VQDSASPLVTPAPKPAHPVVFDVEYPERLSRVYIFFKFIAAIPHFIALYLLGIALLVLTIMAWLAILFTGRYPKAFFEFTSGVARWQANVGAYTSLLRDEYPPFSWEPGAYPLTLDIPRADRQSRFRLFIRAFAILPNQIVLGFVQIALFFTTFIAWFAILITGRYPRGLFKFSVGVARWQHRSQAYQYLLRDEYPPYSINASARPGNEVLSAIIGFPFFAAIVALYAMLLSGSFGGIRTTDATLTPAAIERDHPSVKAGSLRLTLLGHNDPATNPQPDPVLVDSGYRLVSFDIEAEKDGFSPALYSPYFFSVKTCDGYSTSVQAARNKTSGVFDIYWTGGHDSATIYFEVARGESVCELQYYSAGGFARFRFGIAATPRRR
jgi:hypothetical protein